MVVMNPLETDFDQLSRSAVGFAKQYGVGVTDVIKSMKIFAQQGLKQGEVVNRAQVSTLAANVTTLAAAEATEALTAAMKSFGPEIGSAMTALDSWSEVEAKHAITAGDMANAIKKSAAAARNAGFTFNELNGVVASIGAVTRQSGKEVGTAMRFIFRRLTAEKGPKVLAEIGIPTITGGGELRRGFDVLSDLSAQWADLTSAQKMNIAQAIGGTRQYNAVLVLMDNWNEALSAIEHSTNSKGSAERRNLEIMKTYAKQLEQTRAAATELKMEFGKFVFPAFKVGLKGLKTVLEIMSAIPAPIKVAGAALTMFFAYASKGVGIFDSLSSVLDRGQSAIANFYGEFKKQGDISLFEVLGRKRPALDVRGLKTMAPGVEGATKGTEFKDFHSGIGKLAFLSKNVGDSYNEFLGNLAGNTLSATATAGEAIASLSDRLQNLGYILQGSALLTPGTLDDLAMGFINISRTGTEGLGEVLQFIGTKFGPKAEKFAADAAAHNTGLVKSLLPLGLTAVAVAKSFDSLYSGYVRMGKSAQDYAKHVYNIKRVQETELQSVRDLMGSYKMLEQRLVDVNKVIQQPELKEKRQSYDTYVDPLLSLSKIQSDAIGVTNRLAEANLALISGYDKFGNAVLKTSVNLQAYFKTLEKSKLVGIARTDIDVATKFVEDLTTTEGTEKWKYELKSLLKEAPLVGDLLAKGIKVAPAKALDVITGKINNLVALRNKYPLTSVFDDDIKEYQSSLKDVRRGFNDTYADFRKTLSSISTEGLDAKTITDLFKTPGLQKGYELIIEVEPEIKLVNLQRTKADIQKIKPEDVLGAEILKKVKPGVSSYFDVSAELTKAKLETAGIAPRDTSKVMSGDIVTLIPKIAEQFHVAGNQAIVQLKETTDGVYEWVATYFNTKTMQIEERPFDENIQKMVDSIFPVRRIQEDLAERIDALNAFVAGASAGLTGIGKKDFKKDFSLGERYFADIPTTTLLQSGKGFTPGKGFGESPFQKEWTKTIEDFFFKPMREYKQKLGQLSKLQLTGLEESEKVGDITLSKDLYEELKNLQNVLKNNQVVLQYRAVFVDLTKTIEAGTRSLKENLAVEKSRQELDKPTTGFMKGIANGLDNLEVGARSFADLTVKQRALMESPEYRKTAGRLAEVNIRREGQMENIFAADKVKTTLDSIRDVAKGFGASLSPEEMKKYVETVVRTGDMSTAELKIETAKVASNTAMTVQKLDDILANMGDSGVMGGQLGDIMQGLSTGVFDDSTMKTISAMNKTARIRDRAVKDDDTKLLSASNTVLDKLVKKLVDNIGFKHAVKQVEGREISPFLSQPFSSKEFKQRAFAGLDSKVFIEKMTKYGDESSTSFSKKLSQILTSGLIRKAITGATGTKEIPAFEESKELKQLRKLQEDGNKKAFADSKSLVKAATAFTVFEQFNKQHSSKVLTSLESQAGELDDQISATKAGNAAADTSKLEDGLKSVKQAIEKEKESLEFHKMAQAVTMISGGALQFGRAVGLSEGAVKKLGAGAIATYGAWKLVSQVTGKEMPEAAKEFGSVLKEAAMEYKEKGKVGVPLGLKVKGAGEKFEETYGERVKEFTGVTKEEFKKKVESTLGKKAVSEDDIRKEAEKIRQLAKGSEDISRLQQLVLATLAATFAGYANEKLQPGVRSATLEKRAEEESKLLEEMMKIYPKAVGSIIEEMRQEAKKADSKPVKLDTETKSLVLDTEDEYKKVLQDTSKFREGLVSEYQDIAEETKKLQDSLNEIELVKGLEKQINDINRGFVDRIQRFEVGRMYGGPATLNKQLRGFPGEVELPMDTTDMTTQQRTFTNFSQKFKDSVAVYSFSLQEMSVLQEDYGNLLAQRRQFIEDDIDDTEAWDKLEDQINDTKDTLDSMTDSLRRVGDPLSNLFKFTEAIYKLKGALGEVAVIDAVESIRGFKEFQKELDKLLGGPSADAVTQISPKFEREAAGVGIRLTNLKTTTKEAEEARIFIAMSKASGEELRLLRQEFVDLPEKLRREEEGREQKTTDEKLIRQLAPYEQALSDIERLIQQPGISGGKRQEFRDLQEQIVAAMKRATEKVPGKQLSEEVGGGFWNKLFGTYREDEKRVEEAMLGREPDALIRRGIGMKEAGELDKQFKSITEQLLKEVPTADMTGMKLAVTEPLLRELEKHTGLLIGIAKESGVKDIGVDLRSRYAGEYEEITKQPGLLDKIGTITSPIRMINKLMDSISKATDGKIPSGDKIFEKIKDVTSPISIINKLMESFSKLIGFGEGRASGGRIFGAGGPTEDKVPAMLSPGEYVIKASSASKLGYNALSYLNEKGELPTFAGSLGKFGGAGASGSFAEGGMVSNWLKTAYDFYFGKKDVEMTGPQDTMGRMSYLSSKETKRHKLDEAFNIDAKGFAEGGMVSNWLKTANGLLEKNY
jgi:TP901 family phage tail tape measure protein